MFQPIKEKAWKRREGKMPGEGKAEIEDIRREIKKTKKRMEHVQE